MRRENFAAWTDSEIVQFFRDASIARAKCGFDATAANPIYDSKIIPAYQALAARGPGAMQLLLALTDDPNPNVRMDAATLGYDADPKCCRKTLLQVKDEPGIVAALALVGLLQKDSQFAAEFEREAREKHHKEMTQNRRQTDSE